ncbi:MAG: hypothetical protein RL764_980 [Pseudomonadota bacterium]|jgi:prophage regulatory protein
MTFDKVLRRKEVEALCGIKCSTLYDWMKLGHFPRPVALGPKAVGWRESDVAAWLESRAQKAA